MVPQWTTGGCSRSDDHGEALDLRLRTPGAVAMRPEIAEFFTERVYQSGLTHNAHPISLAAAAANIQVMQEDNLVEHAAWTGPVRKRMLTAPGRAAHFRRNVRSIGLFGVIELAKRPAHARSRWRLTTGAVRRWQRCVKRSWSWGCTCTRTGIPSWSSHP